MDAWVAFSIAAAAAQTARFMLQKRLSMGPVSATGATFARFVFAAPAMAGLCTLYIGWTGAAVPSIPPAVWGYALVGGIAQILATVVVVHLFSLRNFAVGITLKKTEVILTALVGLVVLGDAIAPLGWLALGVGLAGVVLLSDPPGSTGPWTRRLFNRAAALGLLSGVFFATSGVAYRGATLALGTDDLILTAGWTLAMVTALQTALMTVWLRLREPGQITAVLSAWRGTLSISALSVAGSFCWFAAFSLQTAALVFAVGQVELVLSALVSVLVFRERLALREVLGMALLGVSVVTVTIVG